MALRFYIVPAIGTGVSPQDGIRPEYFAEDQVLGAYHAPHKNYGKDRRFIVMADLSPSDDNFVVSQADVLALPFDLSAALTIAQANIVRTNLDAIGIPSSLVDNGDTWVLVLRRTLWLFTFVSRFETIYWQQTGQIAPSIFSATVTGTSTLGSLPLAVQTALLATADDLGLDRSQVTSTTTLRAIFRGIVNQTSGRQFNFAETLV